MKKSVGTIVFILVIIVALVGFLFLNELQKNKSLDKEGRYLVQGKDNLIAVYEDKLALKIPFELYIDKDKTVEDLVDTGNKQMILDTVNKVLPVPVNEYIVVKFGKINLNVKNAKNIPETVINNKRYILTSSLYSLFNDYYNQKSGADEANENIIVDVLNANGKNGYARKTGETIKNKLGMKYNAANYETNQDESYVILNDISYSKAQDIIMELNEKYLKIQQNTNIPTLANIVVILGKEENPNFEIQVTGAGSGVQSTVNEIKKLGYKKVTVDKEEVKSDQKIIEYAPEDYFIAYKLSRQLNITDMIERADLKNKIRVIIN